jgi:lysophospholipase L1-like esterase
MSEPAAFRRVLVAAAWLWSAAVFTLLIFLDLQGHRSLRLRVDLAPAAGRALAGEVWWTAGSRPFHPADSIAFTAAPGQRRVLVPLPVEVDAIQVRPSAAPGAEVVVAALELETPFAPLRRWDGDHGFAGWHAVTGLASFGATGGALHMRLAGTPGVFELDDVHPLRDELRRRRHLWIALAAGMALGALQTAALLLVLRRLTSGSAQSLPGAAPAAPRRAPRAAWLLAAATTTACLLLAWLVVPRLLAHRGAAVFSETGDYSLALVDHLGRRLSEKDGSLKLALDPDCLYRNAANQRTARFSIDAHGYRGGFDESDLRPRMLVLGGSAAFGFGLDADSEVFTARLAAMEPGWQVVNAAVVGHLSSQELSELVHRGRAVAPAVVVVVDGFNEVYVPILTTRRIASSSLLPGFNWEVFNTIEQRLRLLTVGGAAEASPPHSPEPIPGLLRRVIATYTENLAEMGRVCAARRVRLLVVFQPWTATRRTRPQGEDDALGAWSSAGGPRAAPALYEDLRREAQAFLAARGIPSLDLNRSRPFVDAPGPLYLDVMHPNARGHQLMAAEIHARLAAISASGASSGSGERGGSGETAGPQAAPPR